VDVVLKNVDKNIHLVRMLIDMEHADEDMFQNSFSDFGRTERKQRYAYEKKIHLAAHLKRLTARESFSVPADVIEKLREEADIERIPISELTYQNVRRFLKRLGHSEYYDNIISIMSTLQNEEPLDIPDEVIAKIQKMFADIQRPFFELKGPDRRNMLSYPYLLNKFFHILGMPEIAQHCPLLKSIEKLREQDVIWKKICERLSKVDPMWVFKPSV